MSSFSVGGKAAGAGSTTLPSLSIYAQTSPPVRGILREIGVFNDTDTAVAIRLVRLEDSGTPGSGLTEVEQDEDGPSPTMSAFNTHTVGPTLGLDLGYRAVLGAAKGSGVIWTFGENGLRVKAGKGVGIIIEDGTGQVVRGYFKWDE